MSSLQTLRDFINERLTAAAGEIFTVFEQTVIQHEEEIVRQRRLLEISGQPQIKLHTTESPQQHTGHQKTSSSLKQEEHEAPHIKEEEDLVEVTVTDGESDNPHDSVRDLTTQRLTAAAGEIFTLFEPTVVQYEEEIGRQHRLLEIIWKPQIKLHRTELLQHRDCGEEQLFKQETNSCLELEEPEPPQIKEEPEEPEPSTMNAELKETSIFHSDRVENVPVSEKQADGGKRLCEETYFRLHNDLLVHMRTHTAEKPHSCETCGKSFSHRGGLLVHVRTHTGEKPYSCETCGKRFAHSGSLLVHVRTHTGEKPHSCETCGKSFAGKRSLVDHMRTHTGEKPYSCETCGKSYTQHNYLLVHTRTHTGEKPYCCKTCGKTFSDHSCLVRHMIIHTGEKPYSCETCGKSFGLKHNLVDHVRTHTGEKPYSCSMCGRRFSVQRTLLSHMRIHTGEKPYSCESCGKSFGQRSSLLHHMKSHKELKS